MVVPAHVEEYAAAVESTGAEFGMVLHWDKTQAIAIGSHDCLHTSTGMPIENKDSMTYLGALLTADGRSDSELSRRLGLAHADFKRLQKLWGHANVGRARKVQLLNAFIFSKLQYGLALMWQVKAQLRRLDGFHARCLRRVLGIPPAFISRISNQVVFQTAKSKPLSEQLLHRQLLIIGRAARAPVDHPIRLDTFVGDGLAPQVGRFVRKVGRPRQEWTTEVLKAGSRKFGGAARFEGLLRSTDEKQWRQELLTEYRAR